VNRDQLKKNEGKIVRIRPEAIFLLDTGPEIADIDWLFERCLDDGVLFRRYDVGMGHSAILGYDHIHHFVSDADRGKQYGFLLLTSQIYISGTKLIVEPGVRPPTK
jgi:hypothetical protein